MFQQLNNIVNQTLEAMASYEFAIKKDTLNSGKVIYTPVCRKKAKFFKRYNQNPWERITKIYDDHILLDLDNAPDLLYQECVSHIEAYKKKSAKSIENHVAEEEFHILEEKEY